MKVTTKLRNRLNDYPKSFHSFKDGVDIDDEVIKKWLHQCAERLDAKNNFTFIGSGNSIVFACRLGPDDDGKYEVMFYVCKQYEELALYLDLDEVSKLNDPKRFFEIYKK